MSYWWDSYGSGVYSTPTSQPSQAGGTTDMRIDVYHHLVVPDQIDIIARLDQMQREISGLTAQGLAIMATTKEVLDSITALTAAFAPLPAAIDALEAAINAAGGISAEDQANIDAALVAVQSLAANVASAVTDATDGPAT